MDTHSKNVCVIGILHILACMLFCLEPLIKTIRLIYSKQNDDPASPFLYLGFMSFYILLLVLVILMIRGVIKQNHLLVAPFLIFSILILAIKIIQFLNDQFHGFYYFIADSFYEIAVQIMILYPIYTLYLKLRDKSLKEKSLSENFCRNIKGTTTLNSLNIKNSS